MSIENGAKISKLARVIGHAFIGNDVIVNSDVEILGMPAIFGRSVLGEHSKLSYHSVKVRDYVKIQSSYIKGNIIVYGNASIDKSEISSLGTSTIYGDTEIKNCKIEGEFTIGDKVQLDGVRVIKNKYGTCILGNTVIHSVLGLYIQGGAYIEDAVIYNACGIIGSSAVIKSSDDYISDVYIGNRYTIPCSVYTTCNGYRGCIGYSCDEYTLDKMRKEVQDKSGKYCKGFAEFVEGLIRRFMESGCH